MCGISDRALNPGDRWATSLGKAGYALGPDEYGVIRWIPNRPDYYNSSQSFWMQGSEPGTASFEDAALNVTGTGAGFTYTAGAGRYQGIGVVNTGTTTSGRNGALLMTNTAGVQLSATSGTWIYDALFMIPTLSNGTDTHTLRLGFQDNVAGVDAIDGSYVKIDTNANTSAQFVTSSNSTRTTTSTGVVIVSGVWYRLRITITNNTTTSCFLVVDAAGWDYGAAVATNTTNIPTGAGRETSAGFLGIIKTAGTANRSAQFVFHNSRHEPIRSAGAIAVGFGADDGIGMPAPALGQILGIAASGLPSWVERVNRGRKIPYVALDRISSSTYNSTVTGTGAAWNVGANIGSAGVATPSRYFTGSTSSGGVMRSAYAIASTLPLAFGPLIGTFVYETMFLIPTLSTGAQTFQAAFGWMDTITAALPVNNAVHFLIDSNADTHLNVMTMKAGVVTQNATTLVISANTWYRAMIVGRPVAGSSLTMQMDFYCGALSAGFGSATVPNFGTPLASITTNIPTAAVGAGTVVAKSNGTTSAIVWQTHQTAYQRLAS